MQLQRDDQFTYLGLQTLYDRYFIHHEQRRLETPQIFWMRVAMGLALNEKEQNNERAIEFYNVLSEFHFASAHRPYSIQGQTTPSSAPAISPPSWTISPISSKSSPTMPNSPNGQAASATTGPMFAPQAPRIKGTNGKSQGVIPFLKVANDTAVAVNQCFAPETVIYTAKGIKPISDVSVGDLVLGISGTYREVTEKFSYNQKDPMVAIDHQTFHWTDHSDRWPPFLCDPQRSHENRPSHGHCNG